MKPIRAVQVVGFKKSGKTSLIQQLVSALKKRGIGDIAVIKHGRGNIRRPDDDTGRLFENASRVTGVFDDALLRMQRERTGYTRLIHQVQEPVVIIEGYKQFKTCPRILCLRDREEISRLSAGVELGCYSEVLKGPKIWGPPDIDDLARQVWERGFLLPNLNCGKCGEPDCAHLAAAVLKGKREARQCVYLSEKEDLELWVRGEMVALNPFVSTTLKNTLAGFLQSLKGMARGEVEIRFRLEPDRRPEE